MRATTTSKSQIVGIPPFPCRTKEAKHNGTHPFPTTTSRKRAYLSVGAEPNADRLNMKIANRWKMAVFESYKENGI